MTNDKCPPHCPICRLWNECRQRYERSGVRPKRPWRKCRTSEQAARRRRRGES